MESGQGEAKMRIDEEFSGFISALTDEEYKGLEASILAWAAQP